MSVFDAGCDCIVLSTSEERSSCNLSSVPLSDPNDDDDGMFVGCVAEGNLIVSAIGTRSMV